MDFFSFLFSGTKSKRGPRKRSTRKHNTRKRSTRNKLKLKGG